MSSLRQQLEGIVDIPPLQPLQQECDQLEQLLDRLQELQVSCHTAQVHVLVTDVLST